MFNITTEHCIKAGFSGLALLCSVSVATLHANEVKENKNKLQNVKQQIKSTEQTIAIDQSRKKSVESELERTEKQISFIVRRLHVIRKDQEIQLQRQKVLQAEVDQREGELNIEQAKLAELMRSAFQLERHGDLRVLLNQENPALFKRMMTYHDYINRQRLAQIERVNVKLRALEVSHHALALQTRAIERLKEHREKELAELEVVKSQREQVLVAITGNLSEQGEKLEELRKDEKRLASIIRSLVDLLDDIPVGKQRYKPFRSQKGSLGWPSPGKLARQFGSARGDTNKRWTGVVIANKRGEPVKAVARGRIAFADWLRGYGLLVIIDHGDDYMSLYGHNESIYKDTGEWVEQGEVIAGIGDSGGQSQTGLYFEIRSKGKPVNPVKWCANGRPPRSG